MLFRLPKRLPFRTLVSFIAGRIGTSTSLRFGFKVGERKFSDVNSNGMVVGDRIAICLMVCL